MQLDPAAISPHDAYQLMISCIIPRPIAFVTTLSRDGASNLAEFLAGTNPLDPNSLFRITHADVLDGGGGTQISCTTVAGHTYQLQRRATLEASTFWSNIPPPFPGSGAILILADTNAPTNAERYYRVQAR